VGRFGEQTNLLALPGIEGLIGRPAGSLAYHFTDYDFLILTPVFFSGNTEKNKKILSPESR
jgi:hypothetical protein